MAYSKLVRIRRSQRKATYFLAFSLRDRIAFLIFHVSYTIFAIVNVIGQDLKMSKCLRRTIVFTLRASVINNQSYATGNYA